MAMNDIGPLTGADEGLNHQIVDTFATVAESDYSWTEKVWVSVAAADGSVQADLGLGKYHNRGVIDGFAGVSRGHEQWTVRGSRELRSAPESTAIGPIAYEVVDPLGSVRARLEPNDVQPIAFDLVLSGVTPPFFEDRNLVRNRHSGRVDVNVVRYHQGGWATGTITVGGETVELGGEGHAFGFRDHSWGVRQGVGVAPPDLIGSRRVTGDAAGTAENAGDGGGGSRGGGDGGARRGRSRRGVMKWTPSFFRRPDGTYYETAIFVTGSAWDYSSAYVNEADGRRAPVRSVTPRMRYDTATRMVRGGELHLEMASGETRVIEVEALGDTGFFLKTANYGPWKGHIHGSWKGALVLDGEYIADCWASESLDVLGQFRDTPIRVREGDATGYGIMESIISGEWPELGLTAESDRVVALG